MLLVVSVQQVMLILTQSSMRQHRVTFCRQRQNCVMKIVVWWAVLGSSTALCIVQKIESRGGGMRLGARGCGAMDEVW